uniref:Helicase ATP-binding domain-containing protein n=1 Tax=Mesocestoides corti TaxID=53468 RepID=A0A5K3FBK7_MESCO
MNMTAIGCFDGMDNFTADLRVLTKASLTSSSLSQQLPVDESASSAAKIDLRIEILALTAFDQSSLHDQKSEINSAIKNFFGSCRRFPNFREDFTPLVFFGGLGQLTFDSLEAKTSVKAFRYLPHVQERLSLIFDILGLDEASIDQLGNLLHDLRHLISLLVTTSRVDREALLALIHRAWLEVAGLKSVPSTDESKYNFRKSGLSGFVDDEVVALIDLFSVGMTEFVEANGTSSVPTQNGVQLDSLSVVMRRQMEASIKECQSAKTASIEPESAFDFSKLESYLQPVCTSLNLEVDRVIEMVFTVLKSDRQDETIQGELLDLMGLSQFDTVLDLIHGRTQWLLWYKKYRTRSDAFRGRGNGGRGSGYRKRRGANGSRFSGFGNSDDSKCDLVSQLINDPGALVEQRQRDLDSAACIARSAAYQAYVSVNSTNRRQGAERYPFVFDAMAELMAERPFTERSKMVLPSDAKQKHTDQWDSYDFPVPLTDRSELEALKKTLPREGRLVEISTLDRVGQLAFKGIQRLNLVQSIVFEAAYNSAENLLISAPTGAGKTNTALLAILHLIRQNINPETGVLDTNKFKIVYMAPMKALAAEMTATFGQRLAPLGLRVKECTGDMQLSTQEILETQMLVTTPEKWDVISRKGLGDASLVQALKLLIIDEIHLLHEDRGAVIEALVARTLRQVEVSQSVIRIVGLSATLPNYVDVAAFLRVNPQRGLFYFDARFRPVPLGMSFVGVKSPAGMPNSRHAQQMSMNEACYQRVIEQLRRNEQVMVFVHARGETLRTARWLLDTASQRGDLVHFEAPQLSNSAELKRRIARASDGALREIAPRGVACHHAGMLRPDRSLVERLFAEGAVRVLVCTATLAWGVNLPAHAVIIKGTCIYDPDRSDYVDLDILDVLQIFGRAGRPQFDKFGLATIITTHDKLDHYVRLITNQVPIESKFLRNLNDHLNAEIALGTVSNLNDAVTWLTYTYLFVRLTRSPMHYGITPPMLENDPDLTHFLTSAVRDAAKDLDDAKMVRFEQSTGLLASTDRGRTASLYYINYATASLVREELRPVMLVQDLISLVARANEFAQMKVRDDEEAELVSLRDESCRVAVKNPGTVEGTLTVKVNVLLQAHISRSRPVTHSLVSDMYYVQQNAGRLARYIFEIALRRNWATCASAAHRLSKMIEHRLWFSDTPLWQFIDSATDNCHLLERVDELKLTCERIRDLTLDELNGILRYQGLRGAEFVSRLASYLPVISLDVETQPVTRNILRITVRLTPNFTWVDRHHGAASPLLFWVWVEDPDESCIYHSEVFALSKKMVVNAKKENAAELIFTIPLHEPIPSQYLVRCMSDRFLGSEFVAPIPLRSLRLPHADPPHTDLLTLDPLPVGVLKNSRYEAIYPFTHFNPIQTQVFHTLYHQDVNVLLGAPTGSGKTAAAEFAIFRVFNTAPNKKCVYIAPLKALVRERVDDWNVRIWQKLGKRVVELTGDVSPDAGLLRSADLIVTTPEKWDGVSRSWRQRAYVQQIALIVIDEIHMVGEERGPILEVIVSRANFIANQLNTHIRIVGLSTALANAVDMAAWLRVPLSPLDVAAIGRGGGRGLFNFRPSVRPVPLEVHIQGFPGRHYCPRMALMNKPIFQAIQSHSASKPVLVFVASRRQTRRTAFDLISFASSDFDPHKWLHMDVKEMEALAATMSDANLQVTLPYG